MTTRLDARTRTRDLFDEPDVPEPMIHLGAPSATPRPVPTSALMGAMAAWMAAVFGVCYVALPTLLSAVGWTWGVLDGVWFNLPSFVLASFVAIIGAAALRPTVRTDVTAPRDPVIAASAGGLLTWCVVHNMAPFLRHFDEFAALELVGFIFVNIVEMTLIGMMLASLTRSRAVAFGLGSAFQLLVLGLVLAFVVI